jgi:integrase
MSKSRRQRGTGTVQPYTHANGDITYNVMFYDKSGKRVKEKAGKASEGCTPKLAEKYLRDRIHAVESKGYVKPKPLTFSTYADEWVERGQLQEGWAANTVRAYALAVRRLKRRFGSSRLGDIRKAQVNAYSSELLNEGLGARTVNLTLTVFHAVLKAAVEDELLESNPADGMRRPKNPRYKPRALTPIEVRAMLPHFTDPQCRLAFLTFNLIGIRFKELRGLRWLDIRMTEGKLRIEDSKTEEGERWLPMPKALVDEFMAHFERVHYKHDSDFVFHHPTSGRKWAEYHYRDAFRVAQKAAGIAGDIRPAHDMRVTSLTTGVLAGEHPAKLMARAGHRSYETTKGYIDLAGVVAKDDAEAVAGLLLGAKESPQEAPETLD